MYKAIRRISAFAASGAAAVAMLAGIPAGYAILIAAPPDMLGAAAADLQTVRSHLAVMAGLSALMWLMWSAIGICLIVEVGAAARRTPAPRLPGLHLAQWLTAAVVRGLLPKRSGRKDTCTADNPTCEPRLTLPAHLTSVPKQRRVRPANARPAAEHEAALTLVIGDLHYRHTLAAHESLRDIAGRCLGDPRRWRDIWNLNKGRQWPNTRGHTRLRHPDMIFPGWVLHLPAHATPPPEAQRLTPVTPSRHTLAPTVVAALTSPAPKDAVPTLVPVVENQPRFAAPPGPTTVALHGAPKQDLTDGHSGPQREEDAEPINIVRPAPHLKPRPVTGRVTQLPTAADVASLAGGLGLIGPGACAAARAIIGETLANLAEVVVATDTAAQLFGDISGALRPLTITSGLSDALTGLEEELIRRSRIRADRRQTDPGQLHEDPPKLTRVLLVAEIHEPALADRLTTVLMLGKRLNISAIILGEWPTGHTLYVNTDGGTTSGLHLPVLGLAAAQTALTSLPQPAAAPEPCPDNGATQAADPAPERTSPSPVVDPQPEADTEAGTSGDSRIRIRVLGRPEILDAHGQPAHNVRGKARELLAYLAVNRTGDSIPHILEALWPDANLHSAQKRLSTVVDNVRHVIRAIARDQQKDSDGGDIKKVVNPLLNLGGHYRLDPEVVTVDWWQVQDAYERARAASSERGTRSAALDAAISAISGPLAGDPDYDYEWADTDRERVRRQCIMIYAEAARLSRDPCRSKKLLEMACVLDPLDEHLAASHMRAAAADRDVGEVRRRLQLLRATFNDIGIAINQEVLELGDQLIAAISSNVSDH